MEQKVIVFDLGDVLVELNWKEPLALLGLGHLNLADVFHRILTSHEGSYDLFERGLIEEEEFFVRFKKELSIPNDITEIRKVWHRLIVGPVKGIEEVLNQIEDKYPLYILSNIPENVYQYLGLDSNTPLYPFFERFKKIYTSFHFQARKPEQDIYRKTFEDLKRFHPSLQPSDVVFIDDRQDNADGATKFGFLGNRSIPANSKDVARILKLHNLV